MVTAINRETPGLELGATIDRIRADLQVGALSYDKAKAEAAPVIEEMNRRSREIARRRGVRARLFSFGSLMR